MGIFQVFAGRFRAFDGVKTFIDLLGNFQSIHLCRAFQKLPEAFGTCRRTGIGQVAFSDAEVEKSLRGCPASEEWQKFLVSSARRDECSMIVALCRKLYFTISSIKALLHLQNREGEPFLQQNSDCWVESKESIVAWEPKLFRLLLPPLCTEPISTMLPPKRRNGKRKYKILERNVFIVLREIRFPAKIRSEVGSQKVLFVKFSDVGDSVLSNIHHVKQEHVLWADVSHLLQNHRFQPFDQAAPEIGAYQAPGKRVILRVWISVSASNNSSIVPNPPGSTTNPCAYLTNMTLRTKK